MNRIVSIFFTLLMLLNFSYQSIESTNPVQSKITENQCISENTAFADGEKVVYKIYYNWNFVWLSAGEVSFQVKETEDTYILSAHGKTYPAYEWFFKVNDYYESHIDKETMLPYKAIRSVMEGSYTLYDYMEFEQSKQSGTSFRGKTRESAKIHPFTFDHCIHDMLSMVYRMRNIKMEEINPSEVIPIKIFLDMETYPLDVKIMAREKSKKIKGQGRFDTFKISPELIDGNVFKEGQQMKVWVSDDENKIPLIIESPVSVGSIKAVIKEYEGLRNPLTSKH